VPRGSKSPIGSTRVSPNGYHYTNTTEGWELTHRITAAKMLGRPLLPNERVGFKEGFSKAKDYDNPDAIHVAVAKTKSKASRAAVLRAKIAEYEAELEELEAAD
jgi:hypothetical protein